MTLARYVHEGRSYSVTARCVNRRMGLVPSPEVRAALGFAIARAATLYGIRIHVLKVMSNHVHVEVTDPHQKLSRFLSVFKSLVARSLNCKRGDWDYFWEPTRRSASLVTTREDAVVRLAYVLANAVSAGLVRSCEEWPGLSTKPMELLRMAEQGQVTWVFDKPDFFYRKEADGGRVPDRLELTLTPHPLGEEDPVQFAKDVLSATKRLVEKAHREAAARKQRFLSPARVMRTKVGSRPSTKAARRRLIPSFCAKNTERRLALIRGRLDWEKAYAKALQQWNRSGRATFPAGTNAMRGKPGVTVRAGPVLWERA